jgi:hypothetical protein
MHFHKSIRVIPDFSQPNFAKLFKIVDKTGKIRHFQKVKLLQYNKMQILVVCVVTNTYNL